MVGDPDHGSQSHLCGFRLPNFPDPAAYFFIVTSQKREDVRCAPAPEPSTSAPFAAAKQPRWRCGGCLIRGRSVARSRYAPLQARRPSHLLRRLQGEHRDRPGGDLGPRMRLLARCVVHRADALARPGEQVGARPWPASRSRACRPGRRRRSRGSRPVPLVRPALDRLHALDHGNDRYARVL